ncbi:MAG TPA: glycosyltransferase family 39 protein [Candidatus Polarisedimenticolaceae bacterium]|nr:glycosyltransferase family 39 protein [Candidatus Polarisedimenticolaceae bacterium]
MARSTTGGIYAVPVGVALLKLLVHLPVLHRYGFHHDELYFIACGRHPAFGYVDHAPLVPWLARLATALFGESVAGLRIFATLAGAVTIVLVGVLVARLGGGRFAQLLACVAWFVAPVALRTGNMLAIPSFEPLFWLAGSLVLVRILNEDDPRGWPWLGLLAGAGLMNKHSMLFFGFGVALATVVTPRLRRQLLTPWPWIGAAVALLVFLPNVIWQVQHGWPTAGFLRALNENVMAGISKLQFVAGQILYLNPFAAFVWIWGLVFLFARAGRPWRALGVIWLAVFLLLLATDSKIYYLAPAYPAIVAAGGVAIEAWVAACERRRRLKPVLVALPVLGGLLFAPLALPFLSIRETDRFARTITFGAMDNVYELTGDLHGMFGWPERVEAVAEVWRAVPPAERPRTVLFAAGYGNAGAVDFLGDAHGLPDAVSLAENYWMWGLPEGPIDTVIALGFSAETLDRVFETVEVVREVDLDDVNPDSTPFRIAICREPKLPLAELWARNRPW